MRFLPFSTVGVVNKSTPLCNQEPVTLLEYSMNAVTEGIDAIAHTRVLIRGENSQISTHAYTGETVLRTFRYGMFIMFGLFYYLLIHITELLYILIPVEPGQEWISLFLVLRHTLGLLTRC